MTDTPSPSDDLRSPRYIRVDQLRLLWLGYVLLFAGLLAVLVMYFRLEARLSVMNVSPVMGGQMAPASGGSGTGTAGSQPAVKQDLSFAKIETAFEQSLLDELQGGNVEWLEDFLEEQEITGETADQVRAVIVKYMMQVNKIVMMEYQGVNSADQSQELYKVERNRLMRSLNELVNGEIARELDLLLSDHDIDTDEL